jgi:hypothetical protein
MSALRNSRDTIATSPAHHCGEKAGRSDQRIIRDMVEYYRSAGLHESFIDHIVATPPDDMWYPTRRELAVAG